jgi:hypothetical protein
VCTISYPAHFHSHTPNTTIIIISMTSSETMAADQPIKPGNVVAKTGFKWLEVLEREFDTAFVDLDTCMNNWDEDSAETVAYDARTKMTAISSAFAQLVHKSSLVFEVNAKLEQQLSSMRSELIQCKSMVSCLTDELKEKTKALEEAQQQVNQYPGRRSAFMSPQKQSRIKSNTSNSSSSHNGAIHPDNETVSLVQEVNILRKENRMLRNDCLQLQSNLFGAQLANKYLDKELAGRIQQIQLLAKSDLRGVEHDRLWNQLEAEIHLHRHKTVVKACRGRMTPNFQSVTQIPAGNRTTRIINIEKGANEGLGISITGGKDQGIPVIVSELHAGSPAEKCGQLYVGDAILSVNGISLKDMRHMDAANLLQQQVGNCCMEVMFVYPEEEVAAHFDRQDSHESNNYPFLDPQVMGPELTDAATEYEVKKISHERSISITTDDGNNGSEDDNFSSITDTIVNSNRQTYPGVARLCLDTSDPGFDQQQHQHRNAADARVGVHIASCSKKQTII